MAETTEPASEPASELQPVWELPLSPAGLLFTLRKGGRVRIRPVRADDAEGLKLSYQRLSPQSRYYRFFTSRSALGDRLAESLTDIDHERHFAWVVFDPDSPSEVDDESGLSIGAARIIRDADPTSAEAALSVVDEYHNLGIGRFLIELMVHTAADVGIDVLRFEILRENRPMIRLIASMGAKGHPVPGDATVVDYRLSVPPADQLDVPAGALYQLLIRAAGFFDKPA